MWNLQPELTGTLVRLEPLSESHREGLWEAAQPSEIWSWWPLRPAASRHDWDLWFDEALRAPVTHEAYHFATVLSGSGAAVGSTSFCTVREEHLGVEIGWTWLTPSVWGTQVNTDAKYLQLTYAFEHLGCMRVEWDTDSENERSRGALTRLGAQLDGIWRDFWIRQPDGARRSSAMFSMLDYEWPLIKPVLEARIAGAAT